MNKQQQFIKQFFIYIYTDKSHIKWLLASALIFIFIYFIFIYKKPYRYFPDVNNIEVTFYNDSADNGNSVVNYFVYSSEGVEINFTLQEGFIRPYVGLQFPVAPKYASIIEKYDNIELELKGKAIKNVAVYLVTKPDTNLGENVRFREIYFSDKLVISETRQKFSLPVKYFTIPEWWYDANNLSPAVYNPSPTLRNILSINIASGLTPIDNNDRSIYVYQIAFSKNNKKALLVSFLVYLAAIIICVGMLLIRFYKQYTKPKIIEYKPVEIQQNPQKSENDFWKYLHENFTDEQLTLEKVSKATGINSRIISTQINERYGCNFKTYINSIRIAEAQRLLKTSELTFSEIAFHVGFSSLSQFDRVFKRITGQTPSEYIESIKNKNDA